MGAGAIVGSKIAGKLGEAVTSKNPAGDIVDFKTLFGIPAAICLGCFILFLFLYPSKRRQAQTGPQA
jgi:hypothetical protein